MALQVGELFATLKLRDQEFDSGINKAESKFGKMGGALVDVAKKTAVGMVAGIGAFATGSVVAFAPFQEQMREVFTLLPGISDEAMGQMTDDVKGFAKEFGVLPDKVVPALYQSLSAGVPPDNVFDFLETAQKGAKAGVAELETSVDALSSVVNTYGSDMIDAEKASDIIFQTIKGGKTSFNELAGSLYNVLPSASSLGVEFEQVGAGLATLTAQGTPTAQATTQMRAMFDELGKSGTGVDKIFRGLAGQSFQEFIASGGDVQGALQMLEEHASDNNLTMKDLFSSVEAGNAALGLTGKGTEKFSAELEGMKNASGATEEAYKMMSGTIKDQFNKIKASLVTVALDFAEVLEPAISGFLDLVLKAIPLVSETIQTYFEKAKTFIGSLVETLQGSGGTIQQYKDIWINNFNAIMGIVLPIVDFVKEKIMEAVTLIVQWWSQNGSELLSNVSEVFQGIWKIIEFIMPAVLAIVSMVWENVKGVISGALNIISGVFAIFAGLFTGDWSKMWDGVKQLLGGAIEFIWNLWNLMLVGRLLAGVKLLGTKSIGLFKGMWNGIKNGFGAFVAWIQGLVVRFVAGVVKGFTSLVQQGIRNFNTLRTFGASIWSALWNAVRTIVSGMVSGVINFFKSMVTGVKFRLDSILSTAKTIFGKVKTAITKPIEGAKTIVLKIIDTIKNAFSKMKIKIPKPKLPKINVGSKNVAGIPIPTFDVGWFKNGGLFNGPSVIGVGEAGPEAVVPLSGQRMKPFATEIMKQMIGAGGIQTGSNGNPVVVELVIDGQRFARATARHIKDENERIEISEERGRGKRRS